MGSWGCRSEHGTNVLGYMRPISTEGQEEIASGGGNGGCYVQHNTPDSKDSENPYQRRACLCGSALRRSFPQTPLPNYRNYLTTNFLIWRGTVSAFQGVPFQRSRGYRFSVENIVSHILTCGLLLRLPRLDGWLARGQNDESSRLPLDLQPWCNSFDLL